MCRARWGQASARSRCIRFAAPGQSRRRQAAMSSCSEVEDAGMAFDDRLSHCRGHEVAELLNLFQVLLGDVTRMAQHQRVEQRRVGRVADVVHLEIFARVAALAAILGAYLRELLHLRAELSPHGAGIADRASPLEGPAVAQRGPLHVARMSRRAAGTPCKSLIMLGSGLQHVQHEIALRSGSLNPIN